MIRRQTVLTFITAYVYGDLLHVSSSIFWYVHKPPILRSIGVKCSTHKTFRNLESTWIIAFYNPKVDVIPVCASGFSRIIKSYLSIFSITLLHSCPIRFKCLNALLHSRFPFLSPQVTFVEDFSKNLTFLSKYFSR